MATNSDETVGIKFTAEGVSATGASVKDVENKLKSFGSETENVSKKVDESSLSFGRMASSMAAGVVAASAIEGALLKLKSITIDYAVEATQLAARYETLGVSMRIIGNNSGYTSEQMDKFAKGLEKTGISMTEARQQMTRMAQAGIDLANSSKLARIAQDSAVVGNINSSEAFARMIHGIQTGQTEILRGIGINVSMERSYKKLADQLHVSSSSLSQSQKMQAISNAVMEEGEKIAGTYEAAMGTAAKQINSLSRYHENLKLVIGSTFTESLAAAVSIYTGEIKGLNEEAAKLQREGDLRLWGRATAVALGAVADAGRTLFNVFDILLGSSELLAAGITIPFELAYALATDGIKGASDAYDDFVRRTDSIRESQVAAMEGIANSSKIKDAIIASFDATDAEQKKSVENRLNTEIEYQIRVSKVVKAYAGYSADIQIEAAKRVADFYGGDIKAEHGHNSIDSGNDEETERVAKEKEKKRADEIAKIIEREEGKNSRLEEIATMATLNERERDEAKVGYAIEKEEIEYQNTIKKYGKSKKLEEQHLKTIALIRAKADADESSAKAKKLKSDVSWANAVNNLRKGDYTNAMSIAEQMTQGLAKHHQAIFQANKVFALAKAAIALPSAVMESFAAAGGWPWGVIPAALTLATGLEQISAINSATFGGGASAPPSVGGTAGMVPSEVSNSTSPPAQAEVPLPTSATEAKAAREVNIYMRGDASLFDAKTIREELIPAINEAAGDGVTINVRGI